MEQKSEPRRRLTVFGREARTKRIFAWLREGWAYDEIAREEGVSPQRVRQIVSKVLDKRVIDRSEITPACSLPGSARRCAWPATR
jgi:hypothetical protein